MVRSINCATVALALASLISTTFAGTYQPTKDTFFRNSDATLIRGSDTFGRIRDVNTATYLSDFDRAAIETEVRTIIGKPVGALTQSDMAGVEFHWFVKPNGPSQLALDSRYAPTTFQTQSGSGWTEANSSDGFFDVTGAVQWKDTSGNNIASAANAWPQRANNTGIADASTYPVWGGVATDPPAYRDWLLPDLVEFNFLTSPDAAGLAFIQYTNTSNNIDVYSREAAVGNQPYLVVQAAAIPEPASLGLLSLGSLLLLRRRRSA
jgi:hypothetical protein